jgi:hypothetical protein
MMAAITIIAATVVFLFVFVFVFVGEDIVSTINATLDSYGYKRNDEYQKWVPQVGFSPSLINNACTYPHWERWVLLSGLTETLWAYCYATNSSLMA